MNIEEGQIWREVDRRVNRYVQVIRVVFDKVNIANIDLATNALGRRTWADWKRFNGKHGGYELHKDAK